jgi:hypothetical protein
MIKSVSIKFFNSIRVLKIQTCVALFCKNELVGIYIQKDFYFSENSFE